MPHHQKLLFFALVVLIATILTLSNSASLVAAAQHNVDNLAAPDLDETLRGLFDQYDKMGHYDDEIDLDENLEGYDADDDHLFRSKLTNLIKNKVKDWLRIPKEWPVDDDDVPRDDSAYKNDYFYYEDEETDGDYMDALLYLREQERLERESRENTDDFGMNHGVFDFAMDDRFLERPPAGALLGDYSEEIFSGFDKTEFL
uniref:Uncharacterized protein n=1 Tax=Percolomonas cosmopolitus TaxID=63605 RepID=A0A7S1KNV7_9EUKA|mmetsp:Transcript_2231/g.8228  ORF Transcript_2231/g.8228 Transcript_2231/m.8228 type:complete len:201 (+) Transcript_2231:215-817(+)|eukprot:CAMPEP_0117443498 /NCGR_PEP_ID=MMETSP0759-20121206/4725_1 /TAXON_ID=63605 /ORGANISM="Percolomonas cosmopolitus, Strain WS" /LENGTH=200 /DNA_ID=CAMNT_0005235473 /DNA_START=175 /DNA_END=777 /DNA_ORIENTATION=+